MGGDRQDGTGKGPSYWQPEHIGPMLENQHAMAFCALNEVRWWIAVGARGWKRYQVKRDVVKVEGRSLIEAVTRLVSVYPDLERSRALASRWQREDAQADRDGVVPKGEATRPINGPRAKAAKARKRVKSHFEA